MRSAATCSARTCALASICAHSARSRVTAHTKLLPEPARMATSASSGRSSACASAILRGCGSESAT